VILLQHISIWSIRRISGSVPIKALDLVVNDHERAYLEKKRIKILEK